MMAFFLSRVTPRISATGNLKPKTRLKILSSSCIKFSLTVQRFTRRLLITIFLEMFYKFKISKKSKPLDILAILVQQGLSDGLETSGVVVLVGGDSKGQALVLGTEDTHHLRQLGKR